MILKDFYANLYTPTPYKKVCNQFFFTIRPPKKANYTQRKKLS